MNLEIALPVLGLLAYAIVFLVMAREAFQARQSGPCLVFTGISTALVLVATVPLLLVALGLLP